MTLRPAKLFDAAEMHALMQPSVAQGLLLPRGLRHLCENVRDFVVAESAGRLVALGALHFLDEDLAEIQSLAVDVSHRGRGLGGRVVAALLRQAREHQAWKVFALTHAPEFFLRFGFAPTDIGRLPQKFTHDCLACPKLRGCRQVPVIREVFAAGGGGQEADDAAADSPAPLIAKLAG